MNPYLSFGLAMCGVVAISLFFTAYLAVIFNRRAKADLEAALLPLAEIIEGEVDLEEAAANGRYAGHIAQGRVSNSADGPGRVFLTSVVDGAGGVPWTLTIRQPKDITRSIEANWEGAVDHVSGLTTRVELEMRPFVETPGWARIPYDPGTGFIRLTRAMGTRRDIPTADAFRAQLDVCVRVAAINRLLQSPTA